MLYLRRVYVQAKVFLGLCCDVVWAELPGFACCRRVVPVQVVEAHVEGHEQHHKYNQELQNILTKNWKKLQRQIMFFHIFYILLFSNMTDYETIGQENWKIK